MILKRLAEYADRVGLPPPMYDTVLVRWIIDLSLEGNNPTWIPLQGMGKRGKRGLDHTAPNLVRAYAIKPKLLADSAEYVLGLVGESSKPERVAEYHQRFKELTAECARETSLPELAAVVKFLESWNPANPPPGTPCDITSDETITFRVGGRLLFDLPQVRDFWAAYTEGDQGANRMECLICGREAPAMERQPLAIKGIPGGQVTGTQLISANADAFESHGLKASLIAPTCRQCAEAFGKGLNFLLASRDRCLRLGPLAFIFWTREAIEFNPAMFLTQPNDGEVKQLLRSPHTAHVGKIAEADFYATALSASGARVVVRDYLEAPVAQVQENLARWFKLQELVAIGGGEGGYYGVYPLAACLYRDANRDMAANVPQQLLRCALYGTRLPASLLFQAVKRNIAEQGVTRPRAALIKCILLTQKEDIMPQLDPADTRPAYVCGRLLAELEELQRRAIPGAKATLTDRYFGTASSAPASVFGALLRSAQNHLSKLRKDQEGAYYGIQLRLEEILSLLNPAVGFPRTLGLQDQALFSLGYYHQKAQGRKAASDAKERKSNQKSEERDSQNKEEDAK